MENINGQLSELESLEERRVVEWQGVYRQRKAEDDMIVKQREVEDMTRDRVHAAEDALWIERFARLDEELDVSIMALRHL